MAKLTVNRLNSTWTPLNNEEANYKVLMDLFLLYFEVEHKLLILYP